MSVTNEHGAADVETRPAAPKAGRPGWMRMLMWAGVLLVLLSVVRVVTGAETLTSFGTVSAALGLAVPIAMAGLGGLWSERAGVVNIGLEGMMILGTFGAGWIGWQHGPWAGVITAVVFGALGGLVHAVATVTFGVDQIISGVAINILGLGATKFLASTFLDGTPGGGATQSPKIAPIGTLDNGWLGSPLRAVEETGLPVLGDLAGILRGLTTALSLATILALLLIVGSYVVLWKTAFGLRLRSCGEDPYAAESLGVSVYFHKYVAVVMSGALAGYGGAFLAIVAGSIYREGQTAGRGYIGLAAMIFGNWRPGGMLAGAGLFGYTDALQLRSAEAVHALLLLVAILLAVVGVVALARKRWVSGALALVAAAGFAFWYLTTDSVPQQVTTATPYVTTLLVLALASQRLRMPAADGLIYRKGTAK
jgi:general nucleoside transport system permease protein